ncbi:GFA family protein [Aliiglaciecola sp. CAU 1673]|uniref:GFA family protein n=1 Tax=Aliiglaciecola sp. CAU 1673 TaxID=3032595 RepID=UPI0023DA173D|nr:GFA family protein [Aliiglaciecola sp. CAU 1673]MDF2178377.1 GFA family protein [Aliiglaciecola sp. CAU 1673]
MEKPYQGQCLCRAVTFSLQPPLPHLYQCHCSMCRKLSGSSSDTAMFIDKAQFAWIKGQHNIGSYQTDSGYRSDFCQCCGSTLPHAMQNGRQMWVPAGLLPGNIPSQVKAHLFVDSKAHWDPLLNEQESLCHPTMPPMEELDKLLQGE